MTARRERTIKYNSALDHGLGAAEWNRWTITPWNIYGGNAAIFMSIFAPTDGPPDPPDPPDWIRVTDVTLTGEKAKGKITILGTIQLETTTEHSGEGAAVSAY